MHISGNPFKGFPGFLAFGCEGDPFYSAVLCRGFALNITAIFQFVCKNGKRAFSASDKLRNTIHGHVILIVQTAENKAV